MNYNVCLIGTKDTTVKLANRLIDDGHSIDLIITVDARAIDTNTISGFAPVASFAKGHSIDVFSATDYSMRDAVSQDFFDENEFGIGICMGWQRLIPKRCF